MSETNNPHGVDREFLRKAIQKEYRAVAEKPDQDFHFHTGRELAKIVNYEDAWLEGVPEEVIASFAGTGNPFSMGELQSDEKVLDLGCGAGIDSMIAANQVGKSGAVKGIDMTEEMLTRARAGAGSLDLPQLSFQLGHLEELNVDDNWADVIISNGVLNLCPDKLGTYREIHRVLRPGGRIQIADIMVAREVPEGAKKNIDLWTG